MTQAAMQARLPAAPVSPAYSLMSQDHLKLKYLFNLIKPAVVMVQDGPSFEKALRAIDLAGITVVHVLRPCEGIKSVAFAELAATKVTADVGNSIAKITPETVGKLLFTSGSTGMPKGVRHLHSNLAATAETYAKQVLGIREDDVGLSAAKLFFAYGLGNALTFPMSVGATTVLNSERPTPAVMFALMNKYHPSIFFGVPTLFAAMLNDEATKTQSGGDRLRVCTSAGVCGLAGGAAAAGGAASAAAASSRRRSRPRRRSCRPRSSGPRTWTCASSTSRILAPAMGQLCTWSPLTYPRPGTGS